METTALEGERGGSRRPAESAWHIGLLLLASSAFELRFLRHGISTLDEAWPLYAARRLLEGGTLYRDVFFVFPPGHLFGAWLGQALDPPGILIARGVYAAFQVAACVGLYLLGRRVMPAGWALLGGLLLAIGAPGSHLAQMLFGYRYVALAMLALLAFARRLDTGSRRWSLVAGVALGVCLVFRLTPALAAAVAIAAGLVAAERRPGVWLRDLAALALGAGLVALPVFALLSARAGIETVWSEVFVRPVAMTAAQSLPVPPLTPPESWTRAGIRAWFVALQYRGYALLYALYLAALAWRLAGAWRRGERFDRPLLLALVVWGAVYFVRTLGRADEAHLDSALPPSCLLMAHATSRIRRLSWPNAPRARRGLAVVAGVGLLALFGFLSGSDHLVARDDRKSHVMVSTGGEIVAANRFVGRAVDWAVAQIRGRTRPGDLVLDLSASPMLLVLSGRDGPGYRDVVLPGTFRDAGEERAFVERLERRPPALVVWRRVPFDLREERGVDRTAPALVAWVRAHYAPVARRDSFSLWAPKDAGARILGPRRGEAGR